MAGEGLMGLRFFSDKDRPVHLGPYPLERLARQDTADPSNVPPMPALSFRRSDAPHSIVNAMGEYQAMLDAIRDGLVNRARAVIPADPQTRANHLKAFGYFSDASMVGIGPVPVVALLDQPRRNPDIDRLAHDLKTRQTKTLASGIDMIMADLKESMEAPPRGIAGHHTALVFLYEHHRDPRPDEAGADWIMDAQTHRACLRGAETAVVLANYIRLLGFDACAHSYTTSDVDLHRLAVAAGLATVEKDALVAPWLGTRFGLAAVTTDMDLTHDSPLAPMAQQPWFRTQGPAWWLGKGFAKSALNRDPYRRRSYAMGAHPFETLKRVGSPTTYIDEPRVARVPKRADLFARAQFGDLGKAAQKGATGGHYVRKSAPSAASLARSCCCRMATLPRTRPASTRRRPPIWSRLRPISSASMRWASRAARTGRGIPMTRPARPSTRPMIRRSA